MAEVSPDTVEELPNPHDHQEKVSDEEPEVKQKLIVAEAEALALIAERIYKDEFPAVPKDMQKAVSPAEASDLLQWVTKDRFVKFTSFLEKKWEAHRSSACVKDEPESVFRARWSVDTYYTFLREFQEQVGEQNTVVDAVKVMLGELIFPVEAQGRLLESVKADADLQSVNILDMGKIVDLAWEKHVSSCQPFLQRSIAQNQKKYKELWLLKLCTTGQDELVKLLRDFVVESKPHDFVPALSPTEMPTPDLQSWAKGVLCALPKCLRSIVETSTATALQEVKLAHAEFADEPGFLKNFLQDFYYENMQKIISQNKDATYCFLPGLPTMIISDVSERKVVEDLIPTVTPTDAKTFLAVLQKRQEECLAWVAKENLQEVRDMWANQHYYAIFKEVMLSRCAGDAKKHAATRSIHEVDAPSAVTDVLPLVSVAVGDMFSSPPRKARRLHTEPTSQIPLTLVFSDVHTKVDLGVGNVKTIQACVLYFPDAVRHVNVPVKGSRETESAAIFSVLMTDLTAPGVFDAWRDAASQLNTLLLNDRSTQVDGAPVFIEIVDLEVVEEKRKHMTPMRKLASNSRTTFRLLPQVNACNMLGTVRPEMQLVTSNFASLGQLAPFLVSVVGVIGHVSDPYTSNNDNHLQNIRVHNGNGQAVIVKAFDRQVGHPAFKIGNRVLLYFISATTGSAGRAGCFWLFNDAHVVCTHSDCAVESVREEIAPS